MNKLTGVIPLLIVAVAGLAGCSGDKPAAIPAAARSPRRAGKALTSTISSHAPLAPSHSGQRAIVDLGTVVIGLEPAIGIEPALWRLADALVAAGDFTILPGSFYGVPQTIAVRPSDPALLAQASALVGEIHLAGHAADEKVGASLLIDTHGAPVAETVWTLYRRLIDRIGPRPTLVERDDNIPALHTLLDELDQAREVHAQVLDPEPVAQECAA